MIITTSVLPQNYSSGRSRVEVVCDQTGEREWLYFLQNSRTENGDTHLNLQWRTAQIISQ